MIKKTYLQSAMDFANTLEPRFCIGDLDLPARKKKKRYTSSREEDDIACTFRLIQRVLPRSTGVPA